MERRERLIYVTPTTETIARWKITPQLLAGSEVRNDGTKIMPGTTDPGKIDEGDGSDANAKLGLWDNWDSWE